MRKKVKYSITRFDRSGTRHFSGIGEIDDENLYTEYQNKDGETVEHVYEDCLKDLHPVIDKPDQLKGGFFEIGEYCGHEYQTDYNIKFIKIAETNQGKISINENTAIKITLALPKLSAKN